MTGDEADRRRTRGERFRALHAGPEAFVIPNAWDAGTARLLASFGFPALATTSAGLAFALGRRDAEGALTREETLANAAAVVAAVPDLPVSADLEDGFGPRPEDCARTIREAAALGLAGGSVEDATGDPARPLHDATLAAERVAAAAEAARAADAPFVLTARAEGFLHGRPDLDDAVRRLDAYARAGAEVLYAPGLPSLDAVRAVCAALAPRPVNVLVGGGPLARHTAAEVAAAGARRVSVGGALARAALGAVARAARELRDEGGFGWAGEAMPYAQVAALMAETRRGA